MDLTLNGTEKLQKVKNSSWSLVCNADVMCREHVLFSLDILSQCGTSLGFDNRQNKFFYQNWDTYFRLANFGF